ncbi:MAG: RagB/SusD family nutrient uptake outer membrane protein [Bacteroidales bacterium]
MKRAYIISTIFAVSVSILLSSCSDFLDRTPITVPNNQTFLSGEAQVRSYVNGLYVAIPSFEKFGMSVRGEEKNSDNIIAEIFNKRLNGEETLFSSNQNWENGYRYLRNANYFFEYYLVPPALETDEVKSLKGEVHFFRAYWHFQQLKKFGSIPIMNAFWDANATVDGLQIAPAERAEVAKYILEDLEIAASLLFNRSRYGGLRISKEAACLLAMQVALYEGTWEKYHANTAFAAPSNQSEYFLGKVLEWGDLLFEQGLTLNTLGATPEAVNAEDAYANLFNKKDYTNIPEAIFWRKYSEADGVFHPQGSLLAGGVVDHEGPAGVSGDLVNTYLYRDGTPINPLSEKFKDFNETFKNRDLRLTATIMSNGYKFRSASGTLPMRVQEYKEDLPEGEYILSPYLTNKGNGQSLTGYHIRLGIDTNYMQGNSETGLVIMRYADALLSYAEAAEELGKCTDAVLEKTLKPLRERAGVTYVKPTTIDPYFTNYGYPLSPNLQEIRRERRVELALQGYRLDDLMRWAGASVIAGKRGKGAYLGKDGILYKSFSPEAQKTLETLLVDADGWLDPMRDIMPSGYRFNQSRDYLLPIPPSELELNKLMKQNPGW